MLKIAIIGPESTGKTTLAEALAKHFHTTWVPEFARHYVEQLSRNYTYVDMCKIASQQIKEEKYYEALQTESLPYVFFDTDLIVTKVWFLHRRYKIPNFLSKRLQIGFFDFYLLCSPDLPWYPDPVRENGDNRLFFFDWYKKEIINTEKPYFVVKEFGVQRLENAIIALQQYKETLQK